MLHAVWEEWVYLEQLPAHWREKPFLFLAGCFWLDTRARSIPREPELQWREGERELGQGSC